MAAASYPAAFGRVALLAVDIDGTLTDGTLGWGGPEVGWTQRYTVRDGEAIVRLTRRGMAVVPLSRNASACARARMQHLGLPLRWVGVDDKWLGLQQILEAYRLAAEQLAYVGDGREDAPILRAVGLGCAVANAHPAARDAAAYVTQRVGGDGAIEEIVDCLLAAHGN